MGVRLTGGCTLLKCSGFVQVLDPGGALGLRNLGLFPKGKEKLKMQRGIETLLNQNEQPCVGKTVSVCVCVHA